MSEAKLCECGCGKPTQIALVNSTARGFVKGMPKRFIHGHSGGKPKGPHALTNKDIDKMVAICALCGKVKIYRRGSSYVCAVFDNENCRKFHADNQKKSNQKTRERRLWTLFRLLPEEWQSILTFQGGVCAITGKPPVKVNLSTDHNHLTGQIRGLLSIRANKGLAHFNDDPALLRKAADYLENPPAVKALGKKGIWFDRQRPLQKENDLWVRTRATCSSQKKEDMTINESTQKQSLLDEFNSVCALYAILKTNSSSLRVKQAVYRQGEVPAEPMDFIIDVEVKTKRAIGQQFYDLFLRAVYNENVEILPEYLREALGKAYREWGLDVEGAYRTLYFNAKQGQMREALRARGEHD